MQVRIQELVFEGTKFRKGSEDSLRSQAGPGRALVVGGPGGRGPPFNLLGFEHLNSVSVNDFEAFCDVFMHLLCIDLWYKLVM